MDRFRNLDFFFIKLTQIILKQLRQDKLKKWLRRTFSWFFLVCSWGISKCCLKRWEHLYSPHSHTASNILSIKRKTRSEIEEFSIENVQTSNYWAWRCWVAQVSLKSEFSRLMIPQSKAIHIFGGQYLQKKKINDLEFETIINWKNHAILIFFFFFDSLPIDAKYS